MSRRTSPLDVYKWLPKKNCNECGVPTCMAFAVGLVEGSTEIENCPYLTEEQKSELQKIASPPVAKVRFGGKRLATIGGEKVLHRHELKLYNPTVIAFEVDDKEESESLTRRIKRIAEIQLEIVGRSAGADAIAITSSSNDPTRFRKAVLTVRKHSDLPLILCSLNGAAIEAALEALRNEIPIVYAATEATLEDFIRICKNHQCPLSLISNDLDHMRVMSKKTIASNVTPILAPVCSTDGLGRTLLSFISIRRAAVEYGYSEFGFPTIGVPAVAWHESSGEEAARRESMLASMLTMRYADVLIMRSLAIEDLLPIFTLRESLYCNPRAPPSINPGIYEVGNPDRNSPVLLTTNFALTYYLVRGDLEKAKVDCYLLVVDTQGMSVLNALAGKLFPIRLVGEMLRESQIEQKVEGRVLILPGLASRISGQLEDETGWKIVVGPDESSDIPMFLRKICGSPSGK